MMRCINDAHLLSPRGFNNLERGAAVAAAVWIDYGRHCRGGRECQGGQLGTYVCLPTNDRHLSVHCEEESGRVEQAVCQARVSSIVSST